MRKRIACFFIPYLILLLWISGCRIAPGGQTTPVLPPTSTATLKPSPQPTPTPTPLMPAGPYPPVVTAHSPRPGQEAPVDTEIVVQFDQPMERDSVAGAFHLLPAVDGDLVWRDDSTLVFRPKTLAATTRYRVAVDSEARSAEGVPLAAELTFAFSTVAPLQVTRVSPANAASEVRADSAVFMAFNRAVIPVECAGQPAQADCPALPLKFSPAVLGSGLWLNPSLYRFDPLSGWAAGVTYQVTLETGVRSVDGAVLAEPYNWSFDTALPVIQEISPTFGQQNVLLDAGVRVMFNTPMDQVNTAGVFSLKAEDGATVSGTVTWADNGALLVFTPTHPLRLGARYTVRVGERARAITSAPLQNPQAWLFETVPAPAVRAFTPADGAKATPVDAPVRLTFAGALDPDTLPSRVQIAPDPGAENIYYYFDRATNTCQLSWDKAPRTEYCVTLLAGAADVYGNVIAADNAACFTTGDLPASIAPATDLDMVTLDAATATQFYFLVRNLKQADFALWEVDEPAFVSARPGSGALVREWTETFNTSPNQETVAPVTFMRRGGALETGYYTLNWTAPLWGERRVHLAVVDRRILLTLAPEAALVWVTDLRSGIPISRTAVRLLDQEGVLLAAGTTDAQGLAQIPISPRSDLWQPVAAVVGELGAPGFGVALTAWQADAAPADFGLRSDYGPFLPLTAFAYTDRALYHPGQTVRFRGIVRAGSSAAYRLPEARTPMGVILHDPQGNPVYSTTLPLSTWGTFAGEIFLPDHVAAGEYALLVTTPDAPQPLQTIPLTVATPPASELAVRVTPELAEILPGQPARALVEVVHALGAPALGAPLHWAVRAAATLGADAALIAGGDATTDAQGRYLIELPTTSPAAPAAEPLRWYFEATVTDSHGSPATGVGELTVHPAGVYLSLQPQARLVRAGGRIAVEAQVWDWTSAPAPTQKVAVTLASRAFSLTASGWSYTDTVVSSLEVTTGDDGRATTELRPPKGGVYAVLAETTDVAGNVARAETLLWAVGDSVIQTPAAASQVLPVADRDRYQVGDTARILLPTPFAGPYQVLMVVAREEILHFEQFTFDEPNPVIEVALPAEYSPAVVVSFAVLRAADETHPTPEARAGYVQLPVDSDRSRLTVTVTPDKQPPYAPGDALLLTIRTTQADGTPAPAEVGLAVVEQATARRRAAASPSLWDAFYGARGLRVTGGDSLLVSLDRLAYSFGRPAGGPAGQSPAGAGASVAPVQTAWGETALWEARLQTDAAGAVQLPFTLPEALATWELTAYAVTADTQVGQAQLELPVTQPLVIRPVTPRFLSAGDRPQVAAVVQNHSDQDLDVTITLTATGAQVEGAAAQTVALPAGGQARVAWTLAVPQTTAEAVSLFFAAEGGKYADTAQPAFGAAAGIPVYHYVAPDGAGLAGVLEEAGTRLEAVMIPEGAIAPGALQIRVDHSLASAVLDGLAYLDAYPYETTDALVNRFMPQLAVYQTLQTLEMAEPALAAQVAQVITPTLARLYARQNPDGGWGWWQGDSDLALTAYTVIGLVRARDAGFAVRPGVLDRALVFVSAALPVDLQSETPEARHILGLYALAEANHAWPTGAAGALYAARETLDISGKAYLILALGRLDPADTRLATLVDDLRAAAVVSARGVHWEAVASAQTWDTDVQATALALTALARFAPGDPLLTPAVQWLLAARVADHWATPYETGRALLALAEYGRAAADWQADYAWSLTLNGSRLAEAANDSAALNPAWDVAVSVSGGAGLPALRPGISVLEISRAAGGGRLYYAARFAPSWPADTLPADSRGMTVRREYCEATSAPGAAPGLCRPVQQVRVGDQIEVRLTLTLPQPRSFVALADPYPAGFAPVALTAAAQLLGDDPFVHDEFCETRAAFFASTLPAGTYQVVYRLRAALPGVYQVLPATAYEMYFSEVWGRSAGGVLGVLPTEGE